MKDVGEYISREAAIKEVAKWLADVFSIKSESGAGTLFKKLRSIPSADVRPVVRGKWIDHQEGRWIYAKCSECGTVHDVKSNFCPNCGADMWEVDDGNR